MAQDIPVQPAALSNFVNGVWTGTAVLAAPGTNVIFRVVDSSGHVGDSAPFVSVLLRITSISRDANAGILRFPTLLGSRYVVESSGEFDGGWTAISPALTGDGGIAQFTDDSPRLRQFYRVRLVP